MVVQNKTSTPPHAKHERGQSMVEYSLILVLVVMALVAAVAATGPAIGNVFSNTVCNLLDMDNCTAGRPSLETQGGSVAFWQTVTAVAANPPQGRPFPTQQGALPTFTFTPGPSPTPSPITPTRTPSKTPTKPPTATPTDSAFTVPHNDPIDQPVWWRTDSSVFLGSDDWLGQYYNMSGACSAGTLTASRLERTLWNQEIDPAFNGSINFNWGTGGPIAGWLTDCFAIRYTRQIYVFGAVNVSVTFSLDTGDGGRLKIDSTQVINDWTDGSMGTPTLYTQALTPGAHTLIVEYYENSGTAGAKLDISTTKGNTPADVNTAAGAVNCPWTQINGTQPNTLTYAWKENSSAVTAGFPPSMRCNLELRGYLDLNGVVNPVMSFWDVWDFGSLTDTTVKLQLASYAPYNADLTGGPNWAGGTSYTLHTASKNYAWTRNELPIPSALGNQVTWRFVMESGTQSTGTVVRRWYLDDVRVIAGATARTFGVCTVSKYTCGSFWDLDTLSQKNDFITTARWDLTTNNGASNDSGAPSMSWDVSSQTSRVYQRFGSEQGTGTTLASGDMRIHYVEFNGMINLQGINSDGTGGTPDWESDTGYPILSIYHAYNMDAGETIELEYTRDTDAPDGTPAVWTRVGTNPIRAATSVISDEMNKLEIQLKDIPNWNTSNFRLRFAFLVSRNNTSGTGWYIDNIAIERDGVPRYSDYPFCDDAEQGIGNWVMGGQWGIATTSGAEGTGRSFSDSPLSSTYVHGQASSMTTRYAIDFNNDTPENLSLYGGNFDCLTSAHNGAANHPILTFWWWHKLAANDNINIRLSRNAHTTIVAPIYTTTKIDPTTAWAYLRDSVSDNQVVWERVEVDLQGAIEKLTLLPWATLTGNTDKYDDDFFLSFELDATTDTSVSDGVYIDSIRIKNYSETSYKLWPQGRSVTAVTGAPVAGAGDGTTFSDDIDTNIVNEWYQRWTAGSTWTRFINDSHSGIYSLHNVADTSNYLHDSFNVIELNTIIDLRGARTTDLPTLYFWNHYSVGSSDSLTVEVAAQDQTEMVAIPPTRNRMGYGYLYQWGSTDSYTGPSSSWEQVWYTGSNFVNNAWVREQVDLRDYADDPATALVNEGKRLRVRFVLNAYQNSGVSKGWWFDDVEFKFRTNNVVALPFSDSAQNLQNWIPEGKWGLAPDQFRGSGGGPAGLGTDQWDVFWFDCINWISNPNNAYQAGYLNTCGGSPSQWGTFFDNVTRTVAGTNAWINARTQPPLATGLVAGTHYIRDFTDVINYDFGTTDRPPGGLGNNTWFDSYAGRFMRNITVTGGDFTFISGSDDGVRVRVDTIPASMSTSPYWNVINNWNYHGYTVDIRNMNLAAGNYQLIVEYFEGGGDATMTLTVGTNRFSFSDTPKAGAGTSFPVVNSIATSSASLLFNGVFNLDRPAGYTAATWTPYIEYWTLWDLKNGTQAAFEVSTDGGFSWTQSNLNANCPPWQGNGPYCDPNKWGDWTNLTEWYSAVHDLRTYANQRLGIRFRLATGSSTNDGWWITDITVADP